MEQWKDINGYEWLYQISNLWRVMSLNYHRTWMKQILKPNKRKIWYSSVILCNNGVNKSCNLHRLVAIAFIPNPLNLSCVLHKDETLIDWILDNSVCNLWWGTKKDNNIDCHKKGRANNHLQLNHPKSYLWKFWKDHNRSKLVLQYSLDWVFIREWGWSRDVERELWITHSSISSCCLWKKRYKTAWWFIWKHK